jgi:acetate---CoA ligase (ADP-forming)
MLAGQLKAAALKHGIRVVGPNTSGTLHLPIGLNLIGARGVRAGGLALMVQSGNVALAFMNEVTARTQEGISVCVGVGNELDVRFDEHLDYLGQHESTRAIAAYVEGFTDARAFIAGGISMKTDCRPKLGSL